MATKYMSVGETRRNSFSSIFAVPLFLFLLVAFVLTLVGLNVV